MLNTCTKNVPKGQWYMDKMKMQDAQLMQASGATVSTDNDQSTMTGTISATNGSSIQGIASQGANRPSWQGLQIHKSGTIYTHSYLQTNKHCSPDNDQSTMTGTISATNGSSIQGIASQGANRPSWQGLQIHKSGTIYTHSYVQTNKHMYNWILLDTCSSIDLFSCA